jgi:hypothetical protein
VRTLGVRATHDDKRTGTATATLFAAPEVATGKIRPHARQQSPSDAGG